MGWRIDEDKSSTTRVLRLPEGTSPTNYPPRANAALLESFFPSSFFSFEWHQQDRATAMSGIPTSTVAPSKPFEWIGEGTRSSRENHKNLGRRQLFCVPVVQKRIEHDWSKTAVHRVSIFRRGKVAFVSYRRRTMKWLATPVLPPCCERRTGTFPRRWPARAG
jgi:hypothetical protein